MKILVLGGEGMLGHKMFQTLLARYPDTACTVAKPLSEPLYRGIDLFREERVIDNVDVMDFCASASLLGVENLASRIVDVATALIGDRPVKVIRDMAKREWQSGRNP